MIQQSVGQKETVSVSLRVRLHVWFCWLKFVTLRIRWGDIVSAVFFTLEPEGGGGTTKTDSVFIRR